jgi:hypothetical protein
VDLLSIIYSLFVLVLLLIVLIGWLAVFHWQTQRALQWWFEQQQQWLCQEAEQVRNGLLQETFAMRRCLEVRLTSGKEEPVQEQQTWIDRIKELDGYLVRLSDDLSPPYLETSLPLAIQSWAQRLKSLSEGRSKAIALHLPTTWHPEPLIRSQTVLTSLNHALHLQGDSPATEILIQLREHQLWADLMVQFHYPTPEDAMKTARSRELHYLIRAFQVLTSGQSDYRRRQSEICLHFRWQLPRNTVKTYHMLSETKEN